jgi:hypothetical protein
LSNASTITKPSSDSAMPRMRIAQIGPLYERIPPKLYGGTERIVSYITEEFVRRGHDVTLFAAGDAQTSAKLHPACPQALRLAGKQDLGALPRRLLSVVVAVPLPVLLLLPLLLVVRCLLALLVVKRLLALLLV